MTAATEVKKRRPVQVKLKLLADADKLQFIKDASRMFGVKRVVQTFPDESDEWLSTMYIAELDPEHVAAAIEHLQKDLRVEYVEPPAPRKLIR